MLLCAQVDVDNKDPLPLCFCLLASAMMEQASGKHAIKYITGRADQEM